MGKDKKRKKPTVDALEQEAQAEVEAEAEIPPEPPDPRISDDLVLDLNRLTLDEYQEFEDLLYAKGAALKPTEMKPYVLKALGVAEGEIGMLDFVRAGKRFIAIYVWEMQERKN